MSDDRPTLLVSLLVGNADLPANRTSALVAVHSLLASDLPLTFTPRYFVLVNGTAGANAAFVDYLSSLGWTVYIEPANVGIGEGRNRLVRQALATGSFDYLMELHNDMVFPAVWARPLLDAHLADDRLAIVGAGFFSSRGYFGSEALGLTLDTDDWQSLVATVERAKHWAQLRHALSTPRVRRGLSCPCIKKWAALDSIGIYYDDLFSWQEYEDTDELRRLEARGWRCGVSLDSWVYHHYLYSRLALRDAKDSERSRNGFREKYQDAAEWLCAYESDLQGMFVP